MPTPPRTSLDEIVRAGRAILEADGLDALTMQRVAAAVGVRPPSLYKRVRDRDALVRLIAGDVLAELGRTLEEAASTGDPGDDLRSIATAFRTWAKWRPGSFALLFGRLPDAWRQDPDAGSSALDAMFRAVARLTADDEVLAAARTVVAWASGFVSMELAGAFRLGGDVDAAFAYGIDRITAAIANTGRTA